MLHGTRRPIGTRVSPNRCALTVTVFVSHCVSGGGSSLRRTESRRARATVRRAVRAESRHASLPAESSDAGGCNGIASGIVGKESVAFTEVYRNDCWSAKGTRMKLTVADPSAVRTRGSQKRDSCRLYSMVTAAISACMGKIIGLTHTGTSSNACGSCSRTNASMCIGTANR